MCQYRYVYYARCRHAEFYLINYCHEALARAGISRIATSCRDAADGAQSPLHRSERLGSSNDDHSQDEEQTTPKGTDRTVDALGEETTRQDLQAKGSVEQIVPPQQRTPPTTWASIARAASAVGAGSVRPTGLPKGAPRATSAETALSPAARLAARFEHSPSTSTIDDAKLSVVYSRTIQQSSPSSSRKRGKGKWVGRGRSSSTSSTTPRHGRHGSDQTIRAGKRAQVCLPDKQQDKQSPSQPDVNSATDFPQLSPNSIGRSSHISDRARSDSSASWAQVARLTSASRPNRSSTSDPTAESDADKLDSQNMALDHRTAMAKTIRFRKPAPTSINAAHIAETPRKRLPTEWTWSATSSPEKGASTMSKRKSTGNLGTAWNSSKEAPGAHPKSPTKTMPFELATARRAAVREQREKIGPVGKIIPAIPKTLTRGKATLKSHSKTMSSDSTSTAQLRTAAHSPFPSSSSQSFATAPEDPHHVLSAPGSPSRIPRLAIRVGRRSGTQTSESEPSSIRPEVRVEVTASEPQVSIQRTPSPPEHRIEDFADNDFSLETIKPEGEIDGIVGIGEEQGKSIGMQDARSEMAESDAAIKRASAAVKDIQSEEHMDPHVHFLEGPETADNAPDLGITCGSPVIQSEESQEPLSFTSAGWEVPEYLDDHEEQSQTPDSQTQLALHRAQERVATPVPDFNDGEAKLKSPQSIKTREVEETQVGRPQTPETISTWPEISGFSGTHGSDLEGPAYHVDEGCEETISRQSGYRLPSTSSASAGTASMGPLSVEEQADTFTPDNGSQLSSQYGRGRSNSDTNTIRSELAVHSDNTCYLDPEFDLHIGPGTLPSFNTRSGSLRGNVTAPSRLNAQAQEFVPGNTFAMGSSHGHARPQMPPEWTNTGFDSLYAGQQPYEEDVSQSSPFNGPHDLVGTSKKKHKKSPKKSLQKSPNKFSSNLWNRSSNNPTNTTGPPGVLAGPSGARWYVPNTNQNTAYGPWRRPTEQHYIGRAGSKTRILPDPDGKTALEKWWRSGWQSVNGGPLTLVSVYEHLKQQAAIHHTQGQGPNRSIFPRPAMEADEPMEYVGYGMLKPCGNVNMIGAYEALPHYPLLCNVCQPDAHRRPL